MQDTIKDLKEQMQNISFVVHEASEERHTREKKNLVICFTCIVVFLIIALIGTNLAWILREKSMENVTETTETTTYDIEQDNESGNNNFIGNDGDING